MNYHVPVTDDAVAEAVNKMMPSKNLKSIKDFQVHYLPNQEFVMGLYLASKAKNDKVPHRVFRNQADVLSTFWRGEIGAADRVNVKES
jgi:DNA-directed RNA polymerase beta' subunit